MRKWLISLLSVFWLTSVANADSYICSYLGYFDDGDLVILTIDIDGEIATVSSGGPYSFPEEYRVLENNEIGIVLVRSGATEGYESPAKHDIYLYTLFIDKTNMKMARGHLAFGDDFSSYREGSCRT